MKTLPEFALILEPRSPDATSRSGFKWVSGAIGKRHKLGGQPDFIQGREWPTCPECAEEMSFIAQIDSLNDEFCFVDCGMIFVFYCFECEESHASVQSY